MLVFLTLLGAAALAALTYLVLERLGREGSFPASFRAFAWGAIGLLLLNPSCPRPAELVRPVVLLDASLSLGARGGRWTEAKAAALRLGDVRLIGTVGADSQPVGGRSEIAGPLVAAVATSRPVWLVTDGEVEDLAAVPVDVQARAGIRVLGRRSEPDLAVTRVEAPERVAARDTLRVQVEVSGYEFPDRKQVGVEITAEGTRWLSGTVPLRAGSGQLVLAGPLPNVQPGPHLVEVTLKDPRDSEPRTDKRLLVITVTPTPGIVVVAEPASWESRFLYRALIDVAALPVRGYLGLNGGQWRRMGDLAPVPAGEVQLAAAGADLLVEFGDLSESLKRTKARGRWLWVATSKAAVPTDGDWYAAAGSASPVAGAFVGLPVDSFPPAVGLAALTPGPKDWTGLTAQLNRRGIERPAVIGRDTAGHREILVGAAGLWRWAFRGGSSEQAYRAWVAQSTSWLLGGADATQGRARPIRPVAEQGRPIVFERVRPDSGPIPIELRASGRASDRRVDTLRFDGAGRAELFLPPGRYDYRLDGAGGVVAVEEYSDELLPRPAVLADRNPTSAVPPSQQSLRDKLWLFGIAIVGLSAEWWWRRRAGLR